MSTALLNEVSAFVDNATDDYDRNERCLISYTLLLTRILRATNVSQETARLAVEAIVAHIIPSTLQLGAVRRLYRICTLDTPPTLSSAEWDNVKLTIGVIHDFEIDVLNQKLEQTGNLIEHTIHTHLRTVKKEPQQ